MPTPEYCPNCGDAVPPRAKACPTCGSDESTGWSDEATAQGLDLPDDKFNYDEFVREEFGGEKAARPASHWLWWVTAVVVLIAMVFGLRLGCS